MNSTNWQNIIDSYLNWIRDNTFVKTVDIEKSCKIIVPFLDRHNDHLEIYAEKENNHIKLSDDGYTLSDLKMSGLEINTQKREQIFNTTLHGFGVKIGDKNDLYVEASVSNIGQKKHYLIQAILAVNDMFNLSREVVLSLFKEDVERYFKLKEIIYSKDIKITGKTGFDHNIDFLIPASKTKLERLIKAMNTAKKTPISNALFAFTDVAGAREEETRNIIIYNDVAHEPSKDDLFALESYGIYGIPWSKRNSYKSELLLN